jgi:DNA/RNA endonuclease G (NUC1)
MKKISAYRLALLLASAAMLFAACEPTTTEPDDPDKPVVPDVPDPDPDPVDPDDPEPITPDPESVTFAEIIEAGCSGTYDVSSAVVVATGAHNTVVYDGTAYMLLYDPDKTTSVGDVVSLSGEVKEFNGVPEWNQPDITRNSTRDSIEYPDPENIDQAYLTSYSSSPEIVYGVASGTKDGYYLKVGSRSLNCYSNTSIEDGEVTVYGFTIGYSKKVVNFVVTSTGSGEDPDPDPEPEPDPDPDPDPVDPDDPDTPSTGKYSWVELPVICDEDSDGRDDNDNTLYYATHFTDLKSPTGDAARNYTVCYSGEHHCPVWVAAPRHQMYQNKNVNRTNAYQQDPDIPSDIQYKSKATGGGCNKGHMLGSAERLASTVTNRQVFYYTNIAPQLSGGFNTGGGGWNTLEDWIDGQVCSDTLYVVIGCYFEKYTDGYGETVSPKTISFGGRSDVDMPTMFYYALLRTKKGSTGKALKDCSASEMKCAAFVRSHTNNHKGQKVTSTEMMSISDLEKVTGFKYFTNVPNAPKSSFTASDWGL